jgi:hypothetical protein
MRFKSNSREPLRKLRCDNSDESSLKASRLASYRRRTITVLWDARFSPAWAGHSAKAAWAIVDRSAVHSLEKFEHDAHDFLRLLHEGNVAGAGHDDEFGAGNAGGNQVAQFLRDELIIV